MVILSRKYNEKEAMESGLIDGVWSEEEAVKRVHERAEAIAEFGRNKENMKKIKF